MLEVDVFQHDRPGRIQRSDEHAGSDLRSLRNEQKVLLIRQKMGEAMADLVPRVVEGCEPDGLAAGLVYPEQCARTHAEDDDTLCRPCAAATLHDIADGNYTSTRQIQLLQSSPRKEC